MSYGIVWVRHRQIATDGATNLFFYYENRRPELQVVYPVLKEDIYKLIENAWSTEEAQAKLQREPERQYYILMRDDWLETVAKDIVTQSRARFRGQDDGGAIDETTALTMHEKVRKPWQAERERVEKELAAITRYPTASGRNFMVER